MAKVIAVVNQKGGVGKTTTAVNLTAALTKLGKRVLLCDFDPQANATSGLGVNKKKIKHSVYDVIINEVPAEEAIVQTNFGHVLPSSADLAGKDVAVQLGTSGESLLNEGGDLEDLAATFNSVVTVDSFLKGFTELEGGAVDAVFVDMPVAAKYAAEHDTVAIIDEDLGAEEYGIAFRSGDAELCAQVEAAVQALVENGTYAEIASKPDYAELVDNLIFLAD